MSKIVTTADFINRAREVHGDRYDYSKVSYVAAIKDVIIICPEHGEFKQRPTNHYIGHGCHVCGGNKPWTAEAFIERANKIHSGRYDYSFVKFVNVESKIKIICPQHGPFLQRVMSHLKGFGCNRCAYAENAKKSSHSIERFLEDAMRAHGDKYDYSEVEYVNALTKVKIICPEHGPFMQNPANHIRDIGCSKCGDKRTADKRRRTTEEFIEEAKLVHGDLYDYSKVEYWTSHDKVEIICLVHGSFWQSPVNHVRGNKAGCPGCAVSGFDQTKPGILYYIAVKTDAGRTLYKIGITNLSIQKRFPALDRARMRVVKIWSFEIGGIAAAREADILSQFSGDRYFGPNVLVGAGNTELFNRDILRLDKKYNYGAKPAVDNNALLLDLPIQLSFDLFSA